MRRAPTPRSEHTSRAEPRRARPRGKLGKALVSLLLALGVLFGSLPVHAAFGFNDTTWEGMSDFLTLTRERLGEGRVKLVATLDWDELTEKDAVIVVHPEVEIDYAEASAFMRDGGRMAVLDDHGRSAAFLRRFQIERIPAPLRPAIALRDNPNLAVALPAVQHVAGHEQGRHPVVRDVTQVVTNHPSALKHPNLTAVLTLPASGEPDATLAVTGIIAERGRLFVMGDPSAFINLMLRYPGNRATAEGLLDYLVEDDSWGKRGGRVFLVVGRFKQTGHYGGAPSFADELKDYWEGFLELLDDTRAEGLPDWVALALGALVALGGAVFMGKIGARAYGRILPRYTRRTPLVAQGGIAGRAAVLAAPTTHRALAMLELKSALVESLGERLGAEQLAGPNELVTRLEGRGVSREALSALKRTLEELAHVERRVVTSQSIRVTSGGVQRMREQVSQRLAEIEAELGSVT
ncbi:MAG: DUF4350 domain-containing protein [Polyangiaceae bacterium]|nr:DUF4350 domain-containing protein [Polyangiaceae bacterium]MCW5790714.1 DUF4350 domain-containing protein [Polyangiaceae bacterium]